MSVNRLAYTIAFIFTILGCVTILFRVAHTNENQKIAKTEAWQLQYELYFEPETSSSRIVIYLPDDTPNYHLSKENLTYNNLLVDNVKSKHQAGRRIVGFPLRKTEISGVSGLFELTHRKVKAKTRHFSNEDRSFYLRAEKHIEVTHTHIKELSENFIDKKIKTPQLIEQIFEFCVTNLVRSDDSTMTGALQVIQEQEAVPIGRARAMVALSRASQIPARIVTGFVLRTEMESVPHTWVEVYHKKQWHSFDPTYSYEWQVPPNYFPIVRNLAKIVSLIGDTELAVKYQIRAKMASMNKSTLEATQSLWSIFNLVRLPIGMRNVMAIILLIPIGALITAFLRHLIGLQTYGTFAPTLLALSFVMADWRTGIVIFLIVLLIGIIGRILMDRIKLLMVPRLGLILTLVIGIMTFAVSMFEYFNLTPSANAVLLPTVILVMMIERFYITELEDGIKHALQLLLGTCVVGFVCYLILDSVILREHMIRFPESLFFVIAMLILIGRYSGYRLSELVRFRDLSR